MVVTTAAAAAGHTERREPLRMTYDEFQAWWDPEAGRRGELVDGEVIEFMAPKTIHQRVSLFLARLLGDFALDRGLGEVVPGPEMKLRAGGSYREPDIAYVALSNAARVTADGIDGPADLVVEIVSDDSVRRDRIEKRGEYEAAGVREYWVVDPRPLRRSVIAYALTDESDYEPILPDARGRLASRVLPGLSIDPTWLWEEPLPDPRTKLTEMAGPESDLA